MAWRGPKGFAPTPPDGAGGLRPGAVEGYQMDEGAVPPDMESVRCLRGKGARTGDVEVEEGVAGVAERKGAPGVEVR